MKYLIFGSLNIDYTYQVEQIASRSATIMASSESRNLGGKGFNQAIALSKALEKGEIYFAGAIGKDGIDFLHELQKYNINTSCIKSSCFNNGKAIIQVDKSGHN